MNSVDTRRFEMLVRVREFGSMHADLFPPSTLGGKAFAAVAAAVADLMQQASSQFLGRGSARQALTSKAVAREALRDELHAIARAARVMAIDQPGIIDRFRLPRGNNDQHLLDAARAFVRDAEPLARRFIEHYLPKDFIADLRDDINEFDAAIRGHEAGRDMHVTAAAGFDAAMDAGLEAIRRLDGLVPARLRADVILLAAWERARRVEPRRRKQRTGTAAPSSSSAAASPGP